MHDDFEAIHWDQKFPTVAASCRRASNRVIPFFAFPRSVLLVIYTTSAIENVNGRLHKIPKTWGDFPRDDAAYKLIWLALHNIKADWHRSVRGWLEPMNQFAIAYGDRFARSIG